MHDDNDIFVCLFVRVLGRVDSKVKLPTAVNSKTKTGIVPTKHAAELQDGRQCRNLISANELLEMDDYVAGWMFRNETDKTERTFGNLDKAATWGGVVKTDETGMALR